MRYLSIGLRRAFDIAFLCVGVSACSVEVATTDAATQSDASMDADATTDLDSLASGFASFAIPLPEEAHYIAGEGVIVDAITGLTWQARVDGVPRTWAEARTYCDALALGGLGFRLPSRIELLSIVIPGRVPAADPIFDAPTEYHWTASSPGPSTDIGYVIYFGSHELGRSLRTTRALVRCVAGEAHATERVVFSDVYEDHGTSLDWERAEGARGLYEEAIARCDASTLHGYDDWRLPSLSELSSTVDERIGRVDPSVFAVSGALLWTQSTDASGYGNWPLDPTSGTVLPGSTRSIRASRCVRRHRPLTE